MAIVSSIAGEYTPSLAVYAVGILVGYWLYCIAQSLCRLRHIPGPFWAKVTNFPRMFWVKTMRAQEIHLDLHETYGDCVRFGPNMVSLSDPSAIPALYPMRTGFPKSLFYRGIMPYTKKGALPAIFTTQDEQQHKALKTPVASLYSLSNVISFEPFVDQVLGVLFEQLDERFVKNQATPDLAEWLQYFAFDVMGTMTFSKRYGFLETGSDVRGLIGAIWDFMLTIGPMTQFPLLDRIIYKSFVADILKNQVAVPILRVVHQAVEERQKMATAGPHKTADISKRDFLSHFMEIQATNKSIPSWSSQTWTFSNVIAGSDSTTVVMRTTVYNILAHKETLDKVYQELREADRTTGLTRPYPKWTEVKDLPYLDACVQEAIRLHPPFSLPLERVVPQGGVTISGRYFPEGTCVGMNPYVVNRHRPTFGEDAETWRPERWLVDDPEQRRKLEASIMTFGAGRRTCMGKYIALLEIKKIVPALLMNYDVQLVDPMSYSMQSSYFFKQENMKARLKRREF